MLNQVKKQIIDKVISALTIAIGRDKATSNWAWVILEYEAGIETLFSKNVLQEWAKYNGHAILPRATGKASLLNKPNRTSFHFCRIAVADQDENDRSI